MTNNLPQLNIKQNLTLDERHITEKLKQCTPDSNTADGHMVQLQTKQIQLISVNKLLTVNHVYLL